MRPSKNDTGNGRPWSQKKVENTKELAQVNTGGRSIFLYTLEVAVFLSCGLWRFTRYILISHHYNLQLQRETNSTDLNLLQLNISNG